MEVSVPCGSPMQFLNNRHVFFLNPMYYSVIMNVLGSLKTAALAWCLPNNVVFEQLLKKQL